MLRAGALTRQTPRSKPRPTKPCQGRESECRVSFAKVSRCQSIRLYKSRVAARRTLYDFLVKARHATDPRPKPGANPGISGVKCQSHPWAGDGRYCRFG